MKIITKVLLAVIFLFIVLLIVGYSLPGEKIVSKIIAVDKIYFFVMADVGCHYNEASWRSDLDTIIQKEDRDGLQVWVEKYVNGDSLLLKTIKITEFDLVRESIESQGKNRLRVIQLKDLDGKTTAIKMSEEVIIKNPFKRLWYLFNDKSSEFVDNYLQDLKSKYKNEGDDPFAF